LGERESSLIQKSSDINLMIESTETKNERNQLENTYGVQTEKHSKTKHSKATNNDLDEKSSTFISHD
jgi:hypothetical protein